MVKQYSLRELRPESGEALPLSVLKWGGKLVITGRNKERLQETYNKLQGSSHIQIIADLTKQEDIERFASEVPELNGFVNSAGISKICPVKRIDRKTIEEIMNVNTTGPILLISQLLKKKKYKRTPPLF